MVIKIRDNTSDMVKQVMLKDKSKKNIFKQVIDMPKCPFNMHYCEDK